MPIVGASVRPSGVGFRFDLDSYVTAIASNSSVQSIRFSGRPAGDHFTLSWGGHTTAMIPMVPSPPASCFIWNKPDLPPGTWDLSVNIFQGGNATWNQWYEVINGNAILGTTLLNHGGDGGWGGGVTNPPKVADPGGLKTRDGNPLYWYPLGRFTTTSAGLAVRASCDGNPPDGHFEYDCDQLRIVSADGLTAFRLGTASPPATVIQAPGQQPDTSSQGWQAQDAASGAFQNQGTTPGVRYLVDPAVAQAAFTALPGVGVDDMAVTGDSSDVNPLRFAFQGALADMAQPAIAATDPALIIDPITEVGGNLPILHRNADPPVTVPRSWVFDEVGGQMVTVAVYPPVCGPDWWWQSVGQYYTDLDTSRPHPLSDGSWQVFTAGYYGQSFNTANPGSWASWSYGPFKGATYQLSLAWTVIDPGQSRAVVITVKDLASNVLGTHTVDQSVAPSDGTYQGVARKILGTYTLAGEGAGFIIVQSNAGATIQVANAVLFERTSPDDTFRISPGDTVSATWGAGFATSRDGGALAARATPYPMANLVGQVDVPAPAPHDCEIGYQDEIGNGSCASLHYTDVTTIMGDVVDTWPTVVPYLYGEYGLNAPPLTYDADGRNSASVPTEDHVLAWVGAADCTITGTGASEFGTAVHPGTPGARNQRTYHFTGDSSTRYGPELKLRLGGLGLTGNPANDKESYTDATDIHIYPAGTDLASPPRWRAGWLARNAGKQCFRYMDMLSTIEESAVTYADFNPPSTRISMCSPARRCSSAISRIEPYTGTEWNLTPDNGPKFLVTTPAPHGFDNYVYFRFSDDCNAVAPLSDGGTFAFSGRDGWILVVNDHQIAYQHGPSGSTASMTGPAIVNPSGSFSATCGSGLAVREMIAAFRLNPAAKSFYFNAPVTATQAALEQLADDFANPTTGLPPGTKLRVEFGNEFWNRPASQWQLCSVLAYHHGWGDFAWYQVYGSNQVWGWMLPRWVAAGRDPADFIRVMGSQHEGRPT